MDSTDSMEVVDVTALNLPASVPGFEFNGTAEVDAFNMVVSSYDAHPPVEGKLPDSYLHERATKLSQILVQHLFSLPVERAEGGALAHLSEHHLLRPASANITLRQIPIPREKPIPQPKPLTRWEKFARAKGIKKRKKSRKVWDPVTKTWRPRWGAPDAINKDDEWVIEEKEYPKGYIPPKQDEEYEDPFIKKKAEKKKRIEEQKKRELRNIREGMRQSAMQTFTSATGSTESSKKKKSSLAGGPILPSLTSAIVPGGMSAAQMSQQRLMKAIKLVQKSTRSMGDHDVKRDDEPKLKKKKRSDKEIMTASGEKEKSRNMKVLNKVIRETEKSNM